MTIEEFIKKYDPVMDSNTGIKQFDWTVGHELDKIVTAQRNMKLCTVVENEGDLELLDGYHFVNRMYYVITRNEVTEPISIVL